MACAVIGQCHDMIAARLLVPIRQIPVDGALRVREYLRRITEDEREVSHGERRVIARLKTRSAEDDVHRSQGEALVDVRLFAQLRRRIHVDVIAPAAAFLDFARGPYRPLVIGLARFVYVGPFELGLCLREERREREERECEDTETAFHLTSLVLFFGRV